jgi:hypothetical protein
VWETRGTPRKTKFERWREMPFCQELSKTASCN